MSSHHIVRDEQEPALLYWEAAQADWEQIGQLLEWSPRVIVHQQALAEALAWGMKLDAVWTEAPALEQTAAAVAHQAPVALYTFATAIELTEVATWLRSINQHSLTLLANATAGDFTILRQAALLYSQLQIQVISHGWRYSYFANGTANKWFPEGSNIKLISFGEQPTLDTAMSRILDKQAAVQEVLITRQGMVKITGACSFWIGEQL